MEKGPIYGELLTDIDGNEYETVIIGNQTWMAENLKTTHYRNGDPIFYAKNERDWNNKSSLEGAYCNFQNSTEYSATHGHLYNWHSISNNKELAPSGWHVATKDDWQELIEYLGGEAVAGCKLKEKRINSPPDVTNEFGFNAIHSGFIYGTFGSSSFATFWWTSNEVNDVWANYVILYNENCNIFVHNNAGGTKWFGYPVRCVINK